MCRGDGPPGSDFVDPDVIRDLTYSAIGVSAGLPAGIIIGWVRGFRLGRSFTQHAGAVGAVPARQSPGPQRSRRGDHGRVGSGHHR